MNYDDRVKVWDDNRKQAEGLFGDAGGLAVWTRREELAPRACVRGMSKDVVQIVTELAVLAIGLEKLIESIAAAEGIDPIVLRNMVESAKPVVRDRTEAAVRIKPRGGGA